MNRITIAGIGLVGLFTCLLGLGGCAASRSAPAGDRGHLVIVGGGLKDDNAAGGSGLLYGNGAVQAQGADILVTASDLSGVYVQGGSSLGHDTIEVRAYDGVDWGAWKTFDLTTRLPNRAPVVTPSAGTQGVLVGRPSHPCRRLRSLSKSARRGEPARHAASLHGRGPQSRLLFDLGSLFRFSKAVFHGQAGRAFAIPVSDPLRRRSIRIRIAHVGPS